jgi:hypothetical protein
MGVSHPPLDIHEVGNQTRSNKSLPSEKADKPALLERREPDISSLAGKAGLDVKAQQPEKKSDLAKNPTGKKRGQPPKKKPEQDSHPLPLTDTDWDQIKVCGAANFGALWKARDEEEAVLKEKKKQEDALKEKKKSAVRKHDCKKKDW